MTSDHALQRTPNRLPSGRQRQSGVAFSLVELLVVIGLIGVIAAILLPVLAAARRKSHETVCLTNVSQIAAGIALYSQDYDERMPLAIRGGLFQAMWYEILIPYLTTTALYGCSGDAFECNLIIWGRADRPAPRKLSYGYNLFVGGDSSSRQMFHRPRAHGEIARPAATVLLTDGGATAVRGLHPEQWPDRPRECWGASILADASTAGVWIREYSGPKGPSARHFGRSMTAFVDGHVKSLAIDRFFVRPGEKAPGLDKEGYSPCLDPDVGCPE